MKTMNALSVITLMPSKKSEVDLFVSKVVNEVLNGEIDPLKLHVNLRAIDKAIGEIKTATEGLALDEFTKHSDKDLMLYGASIQSMEAGTRYDFTKCGDLELVELEKQLSDLSEKVKDRKEFLKNLPKPMSINSDVTGEVYDIYPPTKSSKTTLKITLK